MSKDDGYKISEGQADAGQVGQVRKRSLAPQAQATRAMTAEEQKAWENQKAEAYNNRPNKAPPQVSARDYENEIPVVNEGLILALRLVYLEKYRTTCKCTDSEIVEICREWDTAECRISEMHYRDNRDEEGD